MLTDVALPLIGLCEGLTCAAARNREKVAPFPHRLQLLHLLRA